MVQTIPAASGSLTTTLLAVPVPELVTVIVKPAVSPVLIVAASAVLTMARTGLVTMMTAVELRELGVLFVDVTVAVSITVAPLVDVAAAATVIGAAKPDPAAYQYVLQQLDVAPEACVLFDNKMQHVEGARRLGMTAYLLDRSADEHDVERGVISDLFVVERVLGVGDRRLEIGD